MVNLNDIPVTGSADIEGAPAEINNNKTSFFQFLGDKFNQAVAVPVCRYLNEAVDSLHRRRIEVLVGRICDNIGRVLFSEEVEVMMPQSTLGFIIIVFITFIDIKSQGHGFPFDTHHRAMSVALNSFVFYCFASVAEAVISVAGFDRISVYAIIARLGRVCSLCIIGSSLAALFYF